MFAELTFFSFVDLTEPDEEHHRAYNEWHQLDHRPENLALPGVAWGDRWSRRGELREVGTADPAYEGVDYVAMYWFRSPVEQSVAEWHQLGEDSFQWGRGPLIPGVRRSMLAFFRPVKGYAAPSALVSPEVIPYRPNRGLHLTLTRYADPHSAATHEQFTHEDRTLLPALLDVEGVAGAWTFSFAHHQQHTSLPMGHDSQEAPGSLRIRLLYLDGDPVETCRSVAKAEEALPTPAPEAGQVLLSTPLSTIVPWQDW